MIFFVFLIWLLSALLIVIKIYKLLDSVHLGKIEHPLLRIDVKKILPEEIKKGYKKEFKRVLFVSPSCPPCNGTLEKLVSNNQIEDSLVLALDKNEIEFNKIKVKYENVINVYPVSLKHLKKIKINFFPTLLEMNREGRVKKIRFRY